MKQETWGNGHGTSLDWNIDKVKEVAYSVSD